MSSAVHHHGPRTEYAQGTGCRAVELSQGVFESPFVCFVGLVLVVGVFGRGRQYPPTHTHTSFRDIGALASRTWARVVGIRIRLYLSLVWLAAGTLKGSWAVEQDHFEKHLAHRRVIHIARC